MVLCSGVERPETEEEANSRRILEKRVVEIYGFARSGGIASINSFLLLYSATKGHDRRSPEDWFPVTESNVQELARMWQEIVLTMREGIITSCRLPYQGSRCKFGKPASGEGYNGQQILVQVFPCVMSPATGIPIDRRSATARRVRLRVQYPKYRLGGNASCILSAEFMRCGFRLDHRKLRCDVPICSRKENRCFLRPDASDLAAKDEGLLSYTIFTNWTSSGQFSR